MNITIDGSNYKVEVGGTLIDTINRVGKKLPHVCYHRQLGPIQTCDTCLIEVNGELSSGLRYPVARRMRIETRRAGQMCANGRRSTVSSPTHVVLARVCDRQNWNGLIINTPRCLKSHQEILVQAQAVRVDATSLSIGRFRITNVCFGGRCVSMPNDGGE